MDHSLNIHAWITVIPHVSRDFYLDPITFCMKEAQHV